MTSPTRTPAPPPPSLQITCNVQLIYTLCYAAGTTKAPATTAEVYGPPTPGSNRTDATVAPTDKPDRSDTFGPRPFVGLPDPTNDTVTVAAATFGPASTNVFTATTPPVPNATEAEETTEAPTAETTLDPRETTAANTEKKQNSDDARDDDDDDLGKWCPLLEG